MTAVTPSLAPIYEFIDRLPDPEHVAWDVICTTINEMEYNDVQMIFVLISHHHRNYDQSDKPVQWAGKSFGRPSTLPYCEKLYSKDRGPIYDLNNLPKRLALNIAKYVLYVCNSAKTE